MSRAFSSSPSLPGFAQSKTYAAHRVWKGSARVDPKPVPISRRDASRLYHDARRFERQTRGYCESRYRRGVISKREGKLGQGALAVLQSLLFDFLNNRTGRLDPSYASLASKACVSVRTVARALARLKEAGILNWVQRCEAQAGAGGGGFIMRQISNLYGVNPSSSWRGYKRPPDAPRPDPESWGQRPPMSAGDAFAAGGRAGGQTYLEADPDPLNQALARLGKRLSP
jgi:Helix-turn-helix domain